MTDLTDLEALILGVVERSGPVTSYAVAHEFGSSVTSRWSGSMGAIYPAMGRLERRGLVRATKGRQGRRLHKTYTVTAAGRAGLKAWLSPPLPAGAGGASEDPIRSRVLFLSILSPAQRVAFLEHALERVRSELKRVEGVIAELAAADDEQAVLGIQGARYELKARIAWLRMVRKRTAP